MGIMSMLPLLVLVTCLSDVMGDSNPGTTDHLQEIFIGRCWDYRQIKYKKMPPKSDVGCQEMWDTFFRSFSYQPPCDVTMDHYKNFMDMAMQNLPENQLMFWSGTYIIAHEYAQDSHRFVTLEDTLIGYLANSVVWCGQGSPPGMNMSRCPSWTDCPLEASESFWAAASTAFAKSAKGLVTLVLDGSRTDGKPAYSKQSFFAKYELPSLSDTQVSVVVVHGLDQPPRETCNNGSIVDLKADIEKRGLEYTCTDDPPAVVHLMCADDPSSRECQLIKHRLFSPNPEISHYWNAPSIINDKPERFN